MLLLIGALTGAGVAAAEPATAAAPGRLEPGITITGVLARGDSWLGAMVPPLGYEDDVIFCITAGGGAPMGTTPSAVGTIDDPQLAAAMARHRWDNDAITRAALSYLSQMRWYECSLCFVAVIYVRLSEDKHKGTADEGVGIARQEAECRELADRLGLVVTSIYSDNDLSATTGIRRPDFERMLADRPDVVICWHQDRLLRVSRDLERVLDIKVIVHTVVGGSLDLSTPTGQAVARTVAAWSTYETDQKRLRQKAQQRQRRAAGKPWWAKRPFGWQRDGLLVPAEAEAIRWAYRHVLTGGTLMEVVHEWNNRGMRVPQTGHLWRHTSVRAHLLNVRNIGILMAEGEHVRGTWQPVTDEGTFYRCQAILTAPERLHGGQHTHPYSGLMTCGRCGLPMAGQHVPYGDGVAYRCPTGHLSVAWSVVEETIRTAVVEAALEEGLSRPILPGLDPEARRALEARREALTARLDEVGAAIGRGTLSLRAGEVASQAIEADLAELRAQSDQPHQVAFRTLAEVTERAMDVDNLKRFTIKVHPKGVTPRVSVRPRDLGSHLGVDRLVEANAQGDLPAGDDRHVIGEDFATRGVGSARARKS